MADPAALLRWGIRTRPAAGRSHGTGTFRRLAAGARTIWRDTRLRTLVGLAWLAVAQRHPEVDLWQSDGIHPSPAGTYLAACVFYAAIFRQSPSGLGYHPWLSGGEATQLQDVAAATVLGDPSRWGLS